MFVDGSSDCSGGFGLFSTESRPSKMQAGVVVSISIMLSFSLLLLFSVSFNSSN